MRRLTWWWARIRCALANLILRGVHRIDIGQFEYARKMEERRREAARFGAAKGDFVFHAFDEDYEGGGGSWIWLAQAHWRAAPQPGNAQIEQRIAATLSAAKAEEARRAAEDHTNVK